MQGVHAARVIDQGKAKVVRDGKTCISLGSIHSHEDGDRSVLVRAAKAKGKKANMFCAQRAGETWILAVRVTDGSTELRIDVSSLPSVARLAWLVAVDSLCTCTVHCAVQHGCCQEAGAKGNSRQQPRGRAVRIHDRESREL